MTSHKPDNLLQIAFACFAIGCIALAASGLATLPRPKQQVEELADRVQAGSLYAAAMLAASDSLLRSASDMRPNMQQAQTAMQLQTVTESLQSDVQVCCNEKARRLFGAALVALFFGWGLTTRLEPHRTVPRGRGSWPFPQVHSFLSWWLALSGTVWGALSYRFRCNISPVDPMAPSPRGSGVHISFNKGCWRSMLMARP